jgi:surface polysaccharide O-acyltransferase-like enzyme
MRYLLPALVFGITMQLVEAYAISRLGTNRFFAPQDFLLGTLFFSVAVFLTFKRLTISHPLAAQLGRLSPGIFCIHIIFFNLFTTPASPFFIDNRYVETGNSGMALLVLVLTVASSTATIMLMAQSRSLQQAVR